ncbi:MAG: hypothetical protein WCK02_17600 [Bacteroidota bacterium]
MIYTIKIDDPIQNNRLSVFLKKLAGVQYSVINDIPKNPAMVGSIEEFQKSIEKSRKSVKNGSFLTNEELEKEISKW